MKLAPFKTVLLALALVPCLACSSGGGSLDPELADSLKGVVEQNKQEFGIPGVLAGIWIPGQGSLIIESGVSDLQTGKAIQQSDHFRIGSVTKSFTVTALLQLAEEGRLDLSDPISKYVPGLANGDATLAELADMRSGIFNYTEDPDFVTELLADLLRKWTDQQIVDAANGNAPYFPPGDGWHYSNTNTILLGMVVEQVSGQTLADVIRERIIAPLGLEGTDYPSTPDLPSPFVHGYGFDPLEDVSFSDPSLASGSGAMISTLAGLKKWGEALGTGALLAPASQAQRIASLQPIVFNPCDDTDPSRMKVHCPDYDQYGYGFGEISGWIGHTGEYIGYTSLVMYHPASGAVVAIMANIFGVGGHPPTEIFHEFADILNTKLNK